MIDQLQLYNSIPFLLTSSSPFLHYYLSSTLHQFFLQLLKANKMDASTLFKLAALLNAISVPGHLVMGLQKVYPALELVKGPRYAGAKAGTRNSWDNVLVLLSINGGFESSHYFKILFIIFCGRFFFVPSTLTSTLEKLSYRINS
jgi:hypothetical protein